MNGIINFKSTIGTIMVRLVEITPKQRALIKFLLVDEGKFEKHTLIMEGDDYHTWGNDDDYLGHFIINKLSDGKASLIDSDFIPVTTAPAPAPIQSDLRSVHNDADIAKITTLEEQMAEQQKMINQLKSILISKGMI